MTDAPRPPLLWPQENPNVDYPGWEDINLPDKQAWVQAYMDLFGPFGQTIHPIRAGNLDSYGWTPEDLRTVCASPHNVTTMHPPEIATERQSAALIALTYEATEFFRLGVAASADRRQSYVAHLSETHDWGADETLMVIGVDEVDAVLTLTGADAEHEDGEPFDAVGKHFRTDLPDLFLGPGPTTDALHSALEDRDRDHWLTPDPKEGLTHE